MASVKEQRGPHKRRLSRSSGFEIPTPTPNGNGSALHHRPATLQPGANGAATPHYTPNASPIPPTIQLSPSLQYSNKSTPLTSPKPEAQPQLWGIPLKYLSLITLAVQNASLTISMHYSRVSVSPSEKYSAASAVLMVELLKGSISYFIALSRVDDSPGILEPNFVPSKSRKRSNSFPHTISTNKSSFLPESLANFDAALWTRRASKLRREIISADCWKLSIPAILYVIQNNLQFVAASNLDVATFQVTYQMKILTTAAFSVLMLGRSLSMKKWLALLCLALGVGIVQIQSGAPVAKPVVEKLGERLASLNGTIYESAEVVAETVQSAHAAAMNPFLGFMAVSLACMTSGLAGVYFEMVLKGSKADLWVRNVQLSMFSILPALAPVLFSEGSGSGWLSFGLFKNFGLWAWCTVFIQVFGGLITAVVIKYSDNILKGFATSLSIVFSFLASVALFDFHLTPSFVIGASTVLAATATYNTPDKPAAPGSEASNGHASRLGLSINPLKRLPSGTHGTLMSPASPNAPIIGHGLYNDKKRGSIASLKSIASSFGLGSPESSSSDAGFSSAMASRSSDSHTNGSYLAPNGMDPTRYSPYHTPQSHSQPLPPPSRTSSQDIYKTAGSPHHSPPLQYSSSSSSANGSFISPYASSSPSSPHHSSEYIATTGARGQQSHDGQVSYADGRPPPHNGPGWKMSS